MTTPNQQASTRRTVPPSGLLWIDDHIDRYDPWIKKFGECGTNVDSARSIVEGLRKLNNNSYDVILCDLVMDQVSVLPHLSEIASKAKGAQLFICSGFLCGPEIKKQFQLDKTQYGLVDKSGLPFTDDEPAIRQFLGDLSGSDSDGSRRTERASNSAQLNHKLMFSLDLCLPPDKAEETIVALADLLESRWLVRYSEPAARLICYCHGISTIIGYHWARIISATTFLKAWLGW